MTTRPIGLAFLVLFSASLAVACSGARSDGDSPPIDGGATSFDGASLDVEAPPLCTPGARVACDCRAAAPGIQVCQANGILGPCDCARADAGVAPDFDAGTPSASYPSPPYGTSVGERFAPFGLELCGPSGGVAWRFDGPGFFTNVLTVVAISSMWDGISRRDTPQIESQIVARYAGRRVRFVQILVQGFAPGMPITRPDRDAWITENRLTIPVVMVSLPPRSLPSYAIVDYCARIRWQGRETDVLMSMRAAIDRLLAEPPFESCS